MPRSRYEDAVANKESYFITRIKDDKLNDGIRNYWSGVIQLHRSGRIKSLFLCGSL